MAKRGLRTFTKKIFIAANILTALLFIAGAGVRFFTPARWWFLGLITFILPYLLLLLLLFIVFWLFTKPVCISISLFTLVIGWAAVRNIFSFHFSHSFEIKKKGNALRVMSWNVEQFNIQHYKDKPWIKQQMLDLINYYDPDIACFQEVVAGEKKKGINYFPDIINKLKFKDYFYSYAIKDDFDSYHHFGILMFSKLPIIKKQAFVNNPNDYNSSFQYMDVLKGTDTIRVFNIHLQSLKFSKENLNYLDKAGLRSDSNITESKSIISKIKKGFIKRSVQADFIEDEITHSPYPVIVCGDFNDVPNSYAYATISNGLQDAFVEKGAGISRTFSSISPTLRIDNIFADKKFEVTQFTRIKKLLSDHFPIVSDMVAGKK
ncbi:MAG: endonuclease/exonuclease/phosphatase family protein [Bacteroidota bacterium]|nr:endonuclease/exonuclease/phosphatase family protein [Bacteroidota bacterium]